MECPLSINNNNMERRWVLQQYRMGVLASMMVMNAIESLIEYGN